MGLLRVLFITLLLVFYPLGVITRITFGEAAVTLIDITTGLIVFVWLFTKISSGEKLCGKLLKPIVIFISILALSLIFNSTKLNRTQIAVSASYILRWGMYASMYFVVKDLDFNFKKGLPYFMLASGFLIIIGGFIQYFIYPDLRNLYYLGWDEHLYRMFSSFLDPNFAGAFFVLYFLFVLVFFQKIKLKNYRYVLITILILSLVSILLTFSRSAYIMFFVGVLSLMSIKKQRKLFFLIVIFSVGIFLTSKMVFKSEGTNLLRTASGNARLDSIGNAVVIFKDNPIFGVGFNSYRYAQKRYGFINEDKRLIHSGAGTDNSFLFILATTGIVGFLGFLYLLYKIFNLANRMIKKNQYALILFVSILSLGVNSFFVNSLFFPSLMLWVWILDRKCTRLNSSHQITSN